MNHTINN